MATPTAADALNLKGFLSSVRLGTDQLTHTPMLQGNRETIVEEVSPEDRFVSSLAARFSLRNHLLAGFW